VNKRLWSVDVDALHERGQACVRRIKDCHASIAKSMIAIDKHKVVIAKQTSVLSDTNSELQRRDLPVIPLVLSDDVGESAEVSEEEVVKLPAAKALGCAVRGEKKKEKTIEKKEKKEKTIEKKEKKEKKEKTIEKKEKTTEKKEKKEKLSGAPPKKIVMPPSIPVVSGDDDEDADKGEQDMDTSGSPNEEGQEGLLSSMQEEGGEEEMEEDEE
jgi:outer membrane biosynthesis protein TonB